MGRDAKKKNKSGWEREKWLGMIACGEGGQTEGEVEIKNIGK